MKRRLTDFLHIWSVNRLFVFDESNFQLLEKTLKILFG